MPSPFPGMNPYLESDEAWRDFHQQFIPLVVQMIVPQVRPSYIVKGEKYIFIHERSAGEREFMNRIDVGVTHGDAPSPLYPSASVLDATVHGGIPVAIDVERLSFVEIRDRRSRRFIPTTLPGRGKFFHRFCSRGRRPDG